ncbi:MAG TPA: tetratricopeptide repeat protein [Longimicrobiales bacterium]|nr:tetratricopeptide repeat protein [Longimicrobiales bacterium]
MTNPRIEALEKMLRSRPGDARLLFGLALEYLKLGDRDQGVAKLRAYLEVAEDEGNAWGRLGAVLREMGRDDEAKEAYRRGAQEATRHGHPTMAAEFEDVLDAWDG